MTEYCCKCHIAFAPFEKPTPVQIDAMRRMHEHCYRKHLHELSARADQRVSVAVPVHRVRDYG